MVLYCDSVIFLLLVFLLLVSVAVFIESQNNWGWKGLLELSSPTHCSKQSTSADCSGHWTVGFWISSKMETKMCQGNKFQCLTVLTNIYIYMYIYSSNIFFAPVILSLMYLYLRERRHNRLDLFCATMGQSFPLIGSHTVCD